MPKISAVGLFSCDKFEETNPKAESDRPVKVLKIYFSLWMPPYSKRYLIYECHLLYPNVDRHRI